MKRIKIDSVRPGDILFTARPGKSKWIRRATRGIVSHAMICVQHSSFIDSTLNGVQAHNLQRELFEDGEKVFHFRLKEAVSEDLLLKITDFARAEVGARYSVIEAGRSVFKVFKPRSKRQFCSRLVARAYKHAGIDLVPDADYCSPEALRRSPLLVELAVETEVVSQEEVEDWIARTGPIQAMHQAHNAVLEVARSFDPSVESFNDLYSLLVKQPATDQTIAVALRDSGYLNLWRTQKEDFPWRYDLAHMNSMAVSSELRDYCIGTVQEAYSGGVRFAVNLVQTQMLHNQYPLVSLALLSDLYGSLAIQHEARREVACAWLLKHYPHEFKKHIEEILPHTDYWYSIVDRVEPALAALSRAAVSAESSIDVCSSCGDQPAPAYRLLNDAETMPGVPSLRLCDDCVQIRRGMGNKLALFVRTS